MPRSSMFRRSSNPVLSDKTFEQFEMRDAVLSESEDGYAPAPPAGSVMTVQGAVGKTAILLTILAVTATYTWSMVMGPINALADGAVIGDAFAAVSPWIWGGAIGGLVVALVTIFKKTWSPFTSPVYAALEGLFLGGISAIFEVQYPGIAFQAVALTFGTLFALLMAYRAGLIRATARFRTGVIAATGGIFLVYVIGFVMSFFGSGIPYIHESGTIGIVFSLFVVTIAALNLVLDFDFIEKGSAVRAPKYMEWYAAFGLLVTLVWLYLEILRLLAKLRSRD